MFMYKYLQVKFIPHIIVHVQMILLLDGCSPRECLSVSEAASSDDLQSSEVLKALMVNLDKLVLSVIPSESFSWS